MEHFDQGKSKMGQGKSGKDQGICFLKLCGHFVLDHAISESCYEGIILQKNYGNNHFVVIFHNSSVKL